MNIKKTSPITKKEEITEHADNKIDEDFKGYPHGTAKDETIKPSTKNQHKIAATDKKDGEKQNIKRGSRKSFDKK